MLLQGARKKHALLAELSVKALIPQPPAVELAILCKFFFFKDMDICMFLKPANSETENGPEKNYMQRMKFPNAN